MDVDGPEEWHVAPSSGEARPADPDLDEGLGDDDDDLDDEMWAAPPDAGSTAGGQGGGADGSSFRRHVFGGNSPWATVVVAIVAAAVGVAVGLAFLRSPGPAASASPSSSSAGSGTSAGPAGSAPAAFGPPPGNGGGGGGGGGAQQVQIIGTVTAVSRSSITIGGNGPSITGTFTGATKFTGSVTSPSGIKTGDRVAATLTGSPTNLTVATIQDPAQ